MKLTLSKDFKKNMAGKIGRYEFEVGIFGTVPHNEPQDAGLFSSPNIRQFAGGPVRKQSRQKSEKTTGQIFVDNMKRLNTNLLSEPFEKKNSDIVKFMKGFFDLVAKRGMSERRLENLLQAVVRNPILKRKYGANSAVTADNKGFDRHLFDTGQMFRAIKAKVRNVRK